MDTPKRQSPLIRRIVFVAIVLTIIFASAHFVVETRLSEVKNFTTDRVVEQKALLATIAEVAARNGADVTTEQTIVDCEVSERVQFDELLSQLNTGLTTAELEELDRLFGRCGNYYAVRKSVMVARFEREVGLYRLFVEQLENITGTEQQATHMVAAWENLVSLERKQSDLFSQLVKDQDRIITTLLSGKSATSPEIATILQEVQLTQQTLIVTNTEAAELRATLGAS